MGGLSHSVLHLLLIVCAVAAVLQSVSGGDVCVRRVLRQERSPGNSGRHQTWKIEYFQCDNGCCGERYDQFCCPDDDNDDHDDDDDDEDNHISGVATGFTVASVIVIVTVVVVVISCVCYRARQKRCRGNGGVGVCRRGPAATPSVSTTTTSAYLPPPYEVSITQPNAPSAYDNVSPPSYEDIVATTYHTDLPLPPQPRDKDVTSGAQYNQAFAFKE